MEGKKDMKASMDCALYTWTMGEEKEIQGC